MQKSTEPTNGDTKPPNGEPQPINSEKLVFSPPPSTPKHEEHVNLTTGLSLEKFMSFGCFDSRYVVFWG